MGECYGMVNMCVFVDWFVYCEIGKIEYDFFDSWMCLECEDLYCFSWRESMKNELNGKEIVIG